MTRKAFSKLKWFLIEKICVAPLAFLFRLVPLTVGVRVKNNIATFRKLDFQDEDISMLVGSVYELSRLKSCRKEPDTIGWIKSQIDERSVFYDIGANVGAYSLVASKIGPKVKVFAFEPTFSTYKTLVTNIIENSLETSITPLPIALHETSGLVDMNFSSTESGSAEHSVGSKTNMFGEHFTPVSSVKTMCYSLDVLVDSFSLPLPNFIKIDVDGNELAILKVL